MKIKRYHCKIIANFYLVLCIMTPIINLTQSARILGVFSIAGSSVNILYNRLMKGLADAGHDVTVITAQKTKLPIINGSYTEIELTGFREAQDELVSRVNLWDTAEKSSIFQLRFELATLDIWNETFFHPNVKKLLNSNAQFDAVIIESLFNDCLKIFGQIFKCPLIAFASLGGINPWINNDVANPLLPSYAPHYHLLGDFSKGMTLIDRVLNTLFYLRDLFIRDFVLFPIFNKLLRHAFDNPPNVRSFYNNVSLVLLGSHLSLRPALPMVPNIVDIGGFHIDPPKQLSQDIQDILDKAEAGVIYFSMGTYLRSVDFSENKKRMFLNVFKKLNQTILWKFEDEVLVGKPDNVYIKKWWPQTDILGHPKVKLFITHGGHGSLLETIYHGVPVLVVPVYLDQFNNAHLTVSLGFALKLSYNDEQFSEANLMSKINELLENPVYRNNAKLRSKVFHDRPMKPLDTAIYWIEYVIRYNGADHLKVAGYNMPWYQFYLVDVMILFFVAIGIVAVGCFVIGRKMFVRKRINKTKTQ